MAFNDFCRSIIVSIPVDLTGDAELGKLEEKGVKGRYVSVERLQEVEGGKVHWQMATSSTPGGSIPRFIAESSIDGQISAVSNPDKPFALHMVILNLHLHMQDVPHFIRWFHTVRSEPATATASEPQQLAPTPSDVAQSPTVDDALGA